MDHEKAIFLAERYIQLDSGERALKVLKHASPELAETWLWRANALQQLERYEEAIEAARRGLAIEPDRSYLHQAIARAELLLGRHREAETAIVEALRLNAEEPEAIAVHAMILQALGKREEAARVIRHAVELAPDLRSVRIVHAMLTMPREAAAADDLTLGLLHEEPEGAQEHWLRGVALMQKLRFREASNHFMQAAALEPDNELLVGAARNSRLWIFWPLRATAPYSIWVAWYGMIALLFAGMFFTSAAWKYFWYDVAFVLYAVVAMLSILGQPFSRSPR